MKLISLIKNELIKLFSRKSTVVIISIILAITVLWAAVDSSDFSEPSLYDDESNLPRTECYVDSAASEYNSNIKRAEAAGVIKGDWRAEFYVTLQDATNDYYNVTEYLEYLENETEGFDPDKKAETIAESKAEAAAYRAQIDACWKVIEDNDYAALVSTYYTLAKPRLESAVEWISVFRESIVGQNATEAELAAFDKLSKDVETAVSYIHSAYQTAIANNLKGSSSATQRLNVLNQCVQALPKLSVSDSSVGFVGGAEGFDIELGDIGISVGNDFFIMDKNGFSDYLKAYERMEEEPEYKTYTAFIEGTGDEFFLVLEKCAIIDYTFETGVEEMTSIDSTRNKFRGILTLSLFELVALFGIFIAGGTVASEFMRKTVNMLVIRPVSRGKILLSKYLACLVTVFGVALAGLVLAWLFCGFRYGFSDYFEPYLWFNGESVQSAPFLLWFAGRAALGSIGILFLTTLAFAFSNLTKSTAVSIIVPILIYSFGGVVNIFVSLISNSAATYSPFTYFEFWNLVYHKTPAVTTEFGLADIMGELANLGMGAEYNLLYGALLILAMTAVIYYLSALLFKRRDIK